MDNATAFRSEEMSVLLEKWNTHPFYRAVYRTSGNGIVERHHRTIKSIAERGRVTPLDAVFWYNMSPRSGQDESTIPQRSVHRYTWRHPEVKTHLRRNDTPSGRGMLTVGDEVWVKPPDSRCTSQGEGEGCPR
ncbi:hypothetical protein PoB_004313600 [Plakobranchus ocellatus]|uniref:Integrase catalytic domain-containing protein n=1 Tax=Plakobranchus ocellatus TaxID=259542 RepID=A0AAV4AZN7_9GAST|nr:hypothetical protein PoB_004313600 [Plakobranchus ocellatus]